MTPSTQRVVLRHTLTDAVQAFVGAILRGTPVRRRTAFVDAIPTVVDVATAGTFDLLTWRINAALHTPATVGKIVNHAIAAAGSNGPMRDVVSKILSGQPLTESDSGALSDVIERATVDVLDGMSGIENTAEYLRVPVTDAVRMALKPGLDAARDAVRAVVR